MADLPGRYRHHRLYCGGDLTPDSRTPEWQILQTVPDTAGTLTIDVLTRDADDASLTGLDQFDELAANMPAIAERGLDIHITELDVAIVNDDSEQTQADVYERIVDVCLAQPRCTVLQSWGFTDRYLFRTSLLRPYLSRDYAGKLSYQALQEALGGG